MLKSKIFAGTIILECTIVAAMLVHGQVRYHSIDKAVLAARQNLVKELTLTDFAIWTEARYARHPSQTDFFSPFQDFPGSMEHFPAGAIIAPPFHLQGGVE